MFIFLWVLALWTIRQDLSTYSRWIHCLLLSSVQICHSLPRPPCHQPHPSQSPHPSSSYRCHGHCRGILVVLVKTPPPPPSPHVLLPPWPPSCLPNTPTSPSESGQNNLPLEYFNPPLAIIPADRSQPFSPSGLLSPLPHPPLPQITYSGMCCLYS